MLDTLRIAGARRVLWAPSVVEKDGRFYRFFAANDLQRPGGPLWDAEDPRSHAGGIGVAVADSPEELLAAPPWAGPGHRPRPGPRHPAAARRAAQAAPPPAR